MNFELHIVSPSASYGDPGVTPSEVSSLSLITRIWMWLSQIWSRETFTQAGEAVFCLGPNDTLNGHRFQNQFSTEGLNRYRRRMLARYIRMGISLEQIKTWVQARRKAQRFQTALAGFFSLTFFRRAARHLSRLNADERGIGEICNAPLTPD